jgi:hypothetical protein
MPNRTVRASAEGLPTRRLFLASGSAGAVFAAVSGAAASARSPAVSPDLVSLIDAHREAEEAKRRSSAAADEAEAARRESDLDEAERLYNASYAAAAAIAARLLAWPCATIEDVRAKAAYLRGYLREANPLFDTEVEILLESLAGTAIAGA